MGPFLWLFASTCKRAVLLTGLSKCASLALHPNGLEALSIKEGVGNVGPNVGLGTALDVAVCPDALLIACLGGG